MLLFRNIGEKHKRGIFVAAALIEQKLSLTFRHQTTKVWENLIKLKRFRNFTHNTPPFLDKIP